jgi:phospholipase/carboxylesterase
MPDDMDPAGPVRLVVALHGHDQTEQQAVELWDEGFFFEPNFVLVAVRGPFRATGGYGWFSSDPEVSDVWQVRARRSLRAVEDRVLETVCALQDSLGADPSSTYAIGFSQGGAAAFYVALRNPDVFAGAAAIAGNLDTSLAPLPSPDDVEGMCAFIGLGEDEGPRAVQAVRNSGRLLSDLGVETRVFLYPGGHVVSAACCHALENFFDLCSSPAPENDYALQPSLEPEPGSATDYYEEEPGTEPPPDEYNE